MALLNSTVLRSSRGGAPLLPMVAQPQPVALRSGSSNILMAGQNVAVHVAVPMGAVVLVLGLGVQEQVQSTPPRKRSRAPAD